jgi:integrase
MPRKAKELSALEVSRLTKAGRYAVGVVDGLHLEVSGTGARSWVLRITVGKKRSDIGLGGYPAVTLAAAREAAREARAKVRNGIDPVQEAKAIKSALKASQAAALTFKESAEKYIAAHKEAWKNEKHRGQWKSTLETYAYPHIGSLLIRDIELPNVMAVLEPIWKTKTETASRLRGRIESVIDWATANGYRQGLNPARWRGHLDKLLPKPSKLAKVEHFQALPLSAVGAFVGELRKQEGQGSKALQFAILTATRSGEVRGATWAEIDLPGKLWMIPKERMKAGREHRVPLSPEAIQILEAQPRLAETNLLFPSARGGQLSDMTLSGVIRRMGAPCVPHGFRSSFRDWASERTNYPSDMAEMALAHTISDKVEAAYRRGDMFDKRRRMMADWAKFCGTVESPGAVIPLRKKSAA